MRRYRLSCHGQTADNPTGYTPNSTFALAGLIAYATVGVALSFRVIKSKAWWALCLPIGSFCKASLPIIPDQTLTIFDQGEALGFALRYTSKDNQDSIGLFAIQGLFIMCSPAAFLAFNYIVYGRLISYIGAEHSIMNPQKVAKIFVLSDVFTFLVQVSINLFNGGTCVLWTLMRTFF